MAKRLKFYNEPPNRKRTQRVADIDEMFIQMIDNPGKWTIVEERQNEKNRSTTWLSARAGTGFSFTTTFNHETGLLEVWGSYHPDAS